MSISANITKRTRHRKLRSGEVVHQPRHVLNIHDKRTGRRYQLFFERRADAIAKRDEIIGNAQRGVRNAVDRTNCTVAEAVARYLEDRQSFVSNRTIRNYRETAKLITGPLIAGSAKERFRHANGRAKVLHTQYLTLIGNLAINDLTTADIRAWHRMIMTSVGHYSANRAKMLLRAALAMTAEDFDLRPPVMPTNLGRGKRKGKKAILTPEQVGALLRGAKEDKDYGLYYAFPFLTGLRPSEQLGLLWKEVDFEKNVIRVCRAQDLKGELIEFTKTEAGIREVPMCELLRRLLLEWRVRCPRRGGELHLVFPGLGRAQAWPKPRTGAGSSLLYANFRRRVWAPALERFGLPYVTPHSARHTFISTLQAQGIEVGLVAKIAGHANPNVTLGHYTQAVRGGEQAIAALQQAFQFSDARSV